MNRKERRKSKNKERVKTYLVTEDELLKYKQAAEQKAIEKATVVQMYTGVMYLRDHGYGKKRLTEFVEGCVELMDSVLKDYLDFNDMIQTVYEETGLKIIIDDEKVIQIV